VDWLSQYWVWILIAAAFVGIHLFGHGRGGHAAHGSSGHGGGGCCGGSVSRKDKEGTSSPAPDGHQH
jgi:hypothetical protein